MKRRKVTAGIVTAMATPLVPVRFLRAAVTAKHISGTYVLTRQIEREIRSGVVIGVVRSWALTMDATGEGVTIAGKQASVAVSAPPILSALAELERQRDASHLFPITLDASGLIMRAGSAEGTTLARGVETAKVLIQSLPKAELRRGALSDTLTRIAAMSAAAVSQIPRDLFFPVPGSSTEHRIIPIGEGRDGKIRVTASAEIAPATGLLSVSRRDIVTIVGEDERTANEVWTLRPA